MDPRLRIARRRDDRSRCRRDKARLDAGGNLRLLNRHELLDECRLFRELLRRDCKLGRRPAPRWRVAACTLLPDLCVSEVGKLLTVGGGDAEAVTPAKRSALLITLGLLILSVVRTFGAKWGAD